MVKRMVVVLSPIWPELLSPQLSTSLVCAKARAVESRQSRPPASKSKLEKRFMVVSFVRGPRKARLDLEMDWFFKNRCVRAEYTEPGLSQSFQATTLSQTPSPGTERPAWHALSNPLDGRATQAGLLLDPTKKTAYKPLIASVS